MIELSTIATALRGFTLLYWLLAAGALALAIWKGKGWLAKTLLALVAVAAFVYFPAKATIEQAGRDAYRREAWAYFKKKCETEAGEKIYKTYTGVKSVLVVKPLPPASNADLFDQYWYGDPYSNATPHERRAESAAAKLASPIAPIAPDIPGRGFDFVESTLPNVRGEGLRIVRVHYPSGSRESVQELVHTTVSRFGIYWEDISTESDRKYWIAGSRLRIVDLPEGVVVAERIGYLIEPGFGSRAGARNPWLTGRGPNTTCPPIRNGTFEDRWFVLKVLHPNQ